MSLKVTAMSLKVTALKESQTTRHKKKNTMATTTAKILSLFSPKPDFPRKSRQTIFSSLSPPPAPTLATLQTQPVTQKLGRFGVVGLLGAGLALTALEPASAAELPLLGQLSEPANALSLPTWAIHVSSVVEWIAAMALVWQYGEKSGLESWKGLAWGMVPLLGGAFCACTWHFFYNSESLEVLVALQAALTVIGNTTMCIAAFRIHMSSEERPKNL